MSVKNIRDGLIATIASFGKWDSSEISACDFGIATYSASCVILQPGPGTTVSPISFGTMSACGGSKTKQVSHEISGMVLVKDPGDPTSFLGNLWTAYDDIFNSVNADDTLDGKADSANITSISRPSMDAFIQGEGADYAFLLFSVRATEYV